MPPKKGKKGKKKGGGGGSQGKKANGSSKDVTQTQEGKSDTAIVETETKAAVSVSTTASTLDTNGKGVIDAPSKEETKANKNAEDGTKMGTKEAVIKDSAELAVSAAEAFVAAQGLGAGAGEDTTTSNKKENKKKKKKKKSGVKLDNRVSVEGKLVAERLKLQKEEEERKAAGEALVVTETERKKRKDSKSEGQKGDMSSAKKQKAVHLQEATIETKKASSSNRKKIGASGADKDGDGDDKKDATSTITEPVVVEGSEEVEEKDSPALKEEEAIESPVPEPSDISPMSRTNEGNENGGAENVAIEPAVVEDDVDIVEEEKPPVKEEEPTEITVQVPEVSITTLPLMTDDGKDQNTETSALIAPAVVEDDSDVVEQEKPPVKEEEPTEITVQVPEVSITTLPLVTDDGKDQNTETSAIIAPVVVEDDSDVVEKESQPAKEENVETIENQKILTSPSVTEDGKEDEANADATTETTAEPVVVKEEVKVIEKKEDEEEPKVSHLAPITSDKVSGPRIENGDHYINGKSNGNYVGASRSLDTGPRPILVKKTMNGDEWDVDSDDDEPTSGGGFLGFCCPSQPPPKKSSRSKRLTD